ncbi:AAA family ATPase [Candidatus Pacearchaeota archaeon]|nr:AAA family ATPase [Candidatus Pacearchaeota archaeon]
MAEIYIISGGPGTGKTSTINKLSKRFKVIPEAARIVGDTYSEFKGKSIKEIEMSKFQRQIFEFQKKHLMSILKKRLFFQIGVLEILLGIMNSIN